MTRLDRLTVPLVGTTLVEASAGTGKTHTITDLYLRLLLELELPVHAILVVTYTNAATAELRQRLRQRLLDALAACDADASSDEFLAAYVAQRRATLARDRRRLLNAVYGFDEAAIFTIHGFCQRMLVEHAFESGVAFDTELITNEAPLLGDVVHDFWIRELYAAGPELLATFNQRAADALAYLVRTVITHPGVQIVPRATPATAVGDPIGAAAAFRARGIDAAVAELRRRKQAARVQSFDDLLQQLALALRGPRGRNLAVQLAARFRAVLIDEFQDTDPVQYEIFQRMGRGDNGARAPVVFLIGDPKQAIYAFRGADVFAYLQAKADARGQVHTLLTNHRSDPGLVHAVNQLFTRIGDFVVADIPFHAADPAPGASDRIGGSARGSAALQILFVPRADKRLTRDGKIPKPWGAAPLIECVADDIARFLDSGACIGERAMLPSDIAVLTRTNRQAALMQRALRARGINAVLQSDASVFDSDEAVEVERVLQAIAEPSDSRALRAALATCLLGLDAFGLLRLDTDEGYWDAWVERFRGWHDRWVQRSFIAAFRAVIEDEHAAERLLTLADGERRLTNILHLAELLHAASYDERRGPLALVQWLHAMRTDDAARQLFGTDAAQIRLEGDSAAVKLTTVHKSKGLQYPIVYCPSLWDGNLLPQWDRDFPRFHDAQRRLTLDIGSADRSTHLAAAQREALSEQLRLLYVAVTRARHRCVVVWGAFNQAERSALGYVLHHRPGADPIAASADHLQQLLRDRSDAVLRADLERIAASSGGCIAVADLAADTAMRYAGSAASPPALRCRALTREIKRTWRIASFSALTAAHVSAAPAAGETPASEGLDYDVDAAPAAPVAAATESIALHDFPRGTAAGHLIHYIFEHLDFVRSAEPELEAPVRAALARFGVEERWCLPLCRAVHDVLQTPLHRSGLRLGGITSERRLNELEFILPAAGTSVTTTNAEPEPVAGGLTAARLAEVFAAHATAAVPPAYAAQLAALGFGRIAGFLKGFIDLVFEDAGRWYIVDYKSNFLGGDPAAYRQAAIVEAMAAHHYFLQYHLYTVALHRFLTARRPGYRYDDHFGGVYYCFVRGMAPQYADGNGILCDRPSAAMVDALSQLIAGAAGDAC